MGRNEGTAGAGCEPLIEMLDAAVVREGATEVTEAVKEGLCRLIRTGELRLPERFLQPRPQSYARRLLHRDEALDYSVVVMVWGPGQATQLHDHAGRWCVEGVVRGRIRVTRYELLEQNGTRARFRNGDSIEAGVGTAGSLIPPAEHHVLANALPEAPSVTVHVYAGEILRCNTFHPIGDGWYEAREQVLGYCD